MGRARTNLGLAIVVSGATIFGAQGISPTLPVLQHALGLSDSDVGFVTAAYMLPGTLLAIPLGYLTDRVGRRIVFTATALLYGCAGLAEAFSNGVPMLLGLRILQGVGYAALMPLGVTLIADVYEGARQIKMQALRQMTMEVGELTLPLVGAGLAAWSWRAPLAAQGMLLPVGLLGLALLDDRRSESAGGGDYAGELVEAVRLPGMPAVMLAGFLRFWCKFAIVGYLPFLLVHRHGATPSEGALVLSVGAGFAVVSNFAVVRAVRRVSPSLMLMASVVVVGGALVGFAVAPTWQVAVLVAVGFGIGDGTLQVLQNAFVSIAAPEAVRGGLVSVSAMTRNGGKLVAPLAVGAMLLAVSPPVAFALVGVTTLLVLPALRPLRQLDGVLRPEPSALTPVAEVA